MRTQLAGNHRPSLLAKAATATRPLPKLWTSLFRGIAWPYIELAIRLWIAKLFGFFGFMQILHWEITLAVASEENPIPFLTPNSAAFLSTVVYLVCAALLAIGFMTRYAALPLLLLSWITQLRYTPFDTQLFWMALAGWFAIHGAGSISVDHLLRRGLSDSAIPLIPRIINFSKRLRAYGTPLYISFFRVWLGIALLMAAFSRSSGAELKDFERWLPLDVAARVPLACAWVMARCSYSVQCAAARDAVRGVEVLAAARFELDFLVLRVFPVTGTAVSSSILLLKLFVEGSFLPR